MKTKTFVHDDKEYEIKGDSTKNGFEAAVFHKGRKICANRSVSVDTEEAFRVYHGESGLEYLFGWLENDVRQGIIIISN